jgi:hypothetical protein
MQVMHVIRINKKKFILKIIFISLYDNKAHDNFIKRIIIFLYKIFFLEVKKL